MAELTQDSPRQFEADHQPLYNEFVVPDGTTIYAGSLVAVSKTTGLLVKAGDESAAVFVGIAEGKVVGDGRVRARVLSRGRVVMPVVGVDGNDDLGKPVFALNDNDLSLTDGGDNHPIGRVYRHESGTTAVVAFEAEALRSITV